MLVPSAYSGVLLSHHVDTNRTVRDVLIDKHPFGQHAHSDSPIEDDPPEIHPVLFKFIDASVIRLAALRTTGAAGPSGLSASSWKRQCTSFKFASNDLCDSLAITTQHLCMKFVDPSAIAPFLDCLEQESRCTSNWDWGHCTTDHCQSHLGHPETRTQCWSDFWD